MKFKKLKESRNSLRKFMQIASKNRKHIKKIALNPRLNFILLFFKIRTKLETKIVYTKTGMRRKNQ
jgi:hypothetical protein